VTLALIKQFGGRLRPPPFLLGETNWHQCLDFELSKNEGNKLELSALEVSRHLWRELLQSSTNMIDKEKLHHIIAMFGGKQKHAILRSLDPHVYEDKTGLCLTEKFIEDRVVLAGYF
jgi:hypothetical protein